MTTPVFVISLATAIARQEAFARRARDAEVQWEFVAAERGLVDGMNYDREQAIIAKGRPLWPGELGCYASHFALWRRMVEGGIAQAVILEDDVIVDWKMLKKITEYDFVAAGCDYVRLYVKTFCRAHALKRDFIEESRTLIDCRGMASGTQGYVMTLRGASLALRRMSDVRRPVDDELDRSWAHGLPNLAIYPFPIIEESIASSIEPDRFGSFQMPPALKRRRQIARSREFLLRVLQRVTRSGLRDAL